MKKVITGYCFKQDLEIFGNFSKKSEWKLGAWTTLAIRKTNLDSKDIYPKTNSDISVLPNIMKVKVIIEEIK
jgi:hypothetical protein